MSQRLSMDRHVNASIRWAKDEASTGGKTITAAELRDLFRGDVTMSLHLANDPRKAAARIRNSLRHLAKSPEGVHLKGIISKYLRERLPKELKAQLKHNAKERALDKTRSLRLTNYRADYFDPPLNPPRRRIYN